MFPIPTDQTLSFAKVASYWSRETTPLATFKESLDALVKAWLRGELAAKGAERVDVLRAIYRQPPDLVAFKFVGSAKPQQFKEPPDQGVEAVWLWLVPVPNSKPASWNEENCAEAFEALAVAWDSDRFTLATPVVSGLELTQSNFDRWIKSTGRKTPVFWVGDEKLERAKKLAESYFNLADQSTRVPTQSDFEKTTLRGGWAEGRDVLREAFHLVAQKSGRSIDRGRPKKGG
jgi:hypothetical protein